MIAQADSRKWMACLYNSFLFMEAKIMKMAKKLLAVVLAGVMAVSMLTGCALSDKIKANALEDALNMKQVQNKKDIEDLDNKYEHKSSLDSKAEKLWTLEKVDANNSVALNKTPSTTIKLEAAKIGGTDYFYWMVEAPKNADAKKTAEWVKTAENLHNAVLGQADVKTADIKGKSTKKVEFGTAFVSKTDNTGSSPVTTHYVIVVFEKKAA